MGSVNYKNVSAPQKNPGIRTKKLGIHRVAARCHPGRRDRKAGGFATAADGEGAVAAQSGGLGNSASPPEPAGAAWCGTQEPHSSRRAHTAVDAGSGYPRELRQIFQTAGAALTPRIPCAVTA